ncbi:MAG: 4-hydroxythreonine-4-phosphate dehydrogenase [Sulfuricurvum sp.]|jgi:4-hydroxythreonine-4-phosphate dehydrogenase|uniref:4-hydroxythreonine-4-phosphate dehydrogenase n=1 Tax=Sulfuricurvum sp. TaxID=2025608 RepID=UPI0025F4A97A|nr:4-hydroxythreonine-4-phosphate dehydrogenase [Sulfuricurvum sp.]MCK9372960.1 4-hydroxythreonine-4-phosphate dehydrogenase [Sulfuricurvum sp.]
MQTLKTIAISVGDLNGVGFEILLKGHETILAVCRPLYCISRAMAQQAAHLLERGLPDTFVCHEVAGEFTIRPGVVCPQSGRYSYDSFLCAIALATSGEADAITTLPIHKEAWMMAGLPYVGHTDALRDLLHSDAIMMLGCEELYVALFTEHIPLREVPQHIQTDKLYDFLLRLNRTLQRSPVAVLGLNPHAGDNGVLGDEERLIEEAIERANSAIGKEVFQGPIVPDIAFTPRSRAYFKTVVAMYHDQGLAPLKALYFDEGINVSLGLPLIRTSVDHGTAFDIAYQNKALGLSYTNAIKAALTFQVVE